MVVTDPNKRTFIAGDAAFFCKKLRVRGIFLDKVDDRPFRFMVVFGDKVVMPFFRFDLEVRPKSMAQDTAS